MAKIFLKIATIGIFLQIYSYLSNIQKRAILLELNKIGHDFRPFVSLSIDPYVMID